MGQRKLAKLITDWYVQEQKNLHRDPRYGAGSGRYGYLVAGIANIEVCLSILDYGCGKGELGKALRGSDIIDFNEYDPAIPGKDHSPHPADLVTCIDVIEHIEPDCLVDVLRHLRHLSNQFLFLDIALKFDKGRWLTDGRNSHQIVEEAPFWKRKFLDLGFKIKQEFPTGLRAWVVLLEK